MVAPGQVTELALALASALNGPGNLEDEFQYVQSYTVDRSVNGYLSVLLGEDQ